MITATRQVLAQLTKTADASAFSAALTVTRLDTFWQDDARLDTGPDLGARIRGAWGHRLREAASSGDPEASTAHDFFFPDKTRFHPGGNASPPYRIAAARDGRGLHVTLALFGFAGRWRSSAFDALIDAVQGPPGLWLDGARNRSARLELISADWTRREGVPPITPAGRLALRFQTPLRIGSGGVLGTSFDSVIVGLAERAAQTAPWIGLDFTPRLGHWREVAKSLVYESRALEPVVWDTYSSVNGREKCAGYLGVLEIQSPPDEILPLLAAGTVLHAGRSVSKGCGRFDCYPVPC